MGAYVECELAGDHPNNDACAFESPPCLCGGMYVRVTGNMTRTRQDGLSNGRADFQIRMRRS